jgi:hypothetical protein
LESEKVIIFGHYSGKSRRSCPIRTLYPEILKNTSPLFKTYKFMNKKITTTVAKIMQYKKSLTTSIIAITFAMMFTATIPFQQQEAYANHICAITGETPVHEGDDNACVPTGELEELCAEGAAYNECDLNEQHPSQGTCIDAGENKDACKAAFKADKPKNK